MGVTWYRSGPITLKNISDVLTNVLLAAVVLMIAFSPRLDVPSLGQILGRSAELRLQDLWLVPATIAAFAIALRHRQVLQSPWSPWFLRCFYLLLVVSVLAFVTSGSFTYSQLGYAAKFFQFFVFVLVIAILRYRAGPTGDLVALASLTLGFIVNVLSAFYMQIRGEIALYTSDSTGAFAVFYGPSMVNEPNALSSGLYFVACSAFISALYMTKRLAPVFFAICMLAIAFIIVAVGDRASFVGYISIVLFLIAFRFGRAVFAYAFFALILALFVITQIANMGYGSWRFQTRTIWSSLEGRSGIWLENLGEIPNRLFFGWGPGGVNATRNLDSVSEPHHAYIRILQEFGFIGALIFGTLVFIIFKRPSQEPNPWSKNLKYSSFEYSWTFALKAYLVALLAAGILTDSFTTTISWHMLAVFAGLAWGSSMMQAIIGRGFRNRD
jgi:O-antigen ligase